MKIEGPGKIVVSVAYDPLMVAMIKTITGRRYIQELFWHKSQKITQIYTHVTNKDLMRMINPLDRISQMKGDGNP